MEEIIKYHIGSTIINGTLTMLDQEIVRITEAEFRRVFIPMSSSAPPQWCRCIIATPYAYSGAVYYFEENRLVPLVTAYSGNEPPVARPVVEIETESDRIKRLMKQYD